MSEVKHGQTQNRGTGSPEEHSGQMESKSVGPPLHSHETGTKGQRETSRMPFTRAVLEAYGISSVEGCFANERKSVDLATELATVPSEIKYIVACFLM